MVFVGIFVTMVPALRVPGGAGRGLGVTKPWQFFWASGALSSFLDNAPTYLTFATLAVGRHRPAAPAAARRRTTWPRSPAHPVGRDVADRGLVRLGVHGREPYIGNGPNFMVKALAEESRVRMPSFFGYMAWSVGILVPLFLVVTLVFFR